MHVNFKDGTFDSDTTGTFESDTAGTFQCDMIGTFESDMTGTFEVIYSYHEWFRKNLGFNI